jgi:ABC-type Na+ efflux pump permease subunit
MFKILRDRRLLLLVGLVVLAGFLVAASAAHAQDEWKVKPPTESDIKEGGTIEIPQKNLGDVSRLFVYVIQWVFAIVGVLLAVAALITGAQIAFGGASGTRREEAMQKLFWLLLGMGVCFGAWFLVAVMRGIFLPSA